MNELPDDAGDDRPLDVFELQEEVGGVRDEVLARRLADERAEHLLAQDAALARARDVAQPLERDFRPFHLPDERGVGERIEERERFEVDAVGVAGEEQRVGLDRVEHRRRRPLRDVHVDRAQVLGEDRRGRSVVGADVLEDGAVARLLGVVIDDQVGPVEQAAEVVRLHVDRRDPLEFLNDCRR